MIPQLLLGMSAIQSCGTGRATVLGFDSLPAVPVADDNVTLWVAYTIPGAAVTGGTAAYTITLNGIPFPPTVEDLCTQTTCPKETGVTYNESTWSIFPSGISGKIMSRIAWADQDAAPLWCVETTWRVSG